MNVIVFGSNGGIGHHVVEQALSAGHTVTAVARRPESVTIKHPQLTVRRGDVLDPASVTPLLAGQQAVVSAIGTEFAGAHGALLTRRPQHPAGDGAGGCAPALMHLGQRA